MEKKGAAAPTGCYKCGRPGHWSRDCPFAPSNPNSNFKPTATSSAHAKTSSGKAWATATPTQKPAEAVKVKKVPRQRPKLTPDLLLSNDGLGYVLQHIPRMVKIKGRGHEVSDLGNLIEAYIHWHSRLLPYFSFQQFVERVEKVGASKRVRVCLRELRDRVAKGENPKTLHEPAVDLNPADDDMMDEDVGVPSGIEEKQNRDDPEDDIEEDMFDELYRQAMGEDPALSQEVPDSERVGQSLHQTSALTTPENQGSQQSEGDGGESRSKNQISDEQKTRMEANKLKALERAAARLSHTQPP